MINLYCSYQLAGLTNRTKQIQQRNSVISFGNPAKDMKEIAGIVNDAKKSANTGYVLKRIIRLGELYPQYSEEVVRAIKEIIDFHTIPEFQKNPPLKEGDSGSILNQIYKTIQKNNIFELKEILEKIAVYKF